MLIRKNFVSILLLGTLCILLSIPSYAKKNKVTYTYQTVSMSEHLTQNLYFQGTVTPFNTYTVIAPFDGIITKQPGFYFGQLLKKGQYLFTIKPNGDTDNYRDALIAYLNAKRSYNTAMQKFTGQKLMYDNGLMAKNDFTDVETELLNQKISLDQAILHLQNVITTVTADTNTQQNLLNSLENLNLSDTNIEAALSEGFAAVPVTAPTDGIALTPPTNDSAQTNVSLGINSLVKRGQPLVVIGNLTGLRININVEEINIDKLVKGQAVTVTGPAFSQFTLQGTIQNISYQQMSNQYGGSPTYPATIVVPELTAAEQKIIHDGMSATVAIALPQPNAILIPINAVIIKGNNNFVLKKVDGKLVQTPITTGMTTLDQITVLSGLNVGDTIAIPN